MSVLGTVGQTVLGCPQVLGILTTDPIANRAPTASQAVAGLFQYWSPAAQTRISGRQPDTAPRPKAPEMARDVLMLAWPLLLLTLLDADNVTGWLSAPR